MIVYRQDYENKKAIQALSNSNPYPNVESVSKLKCIFSN